jgi:hypothetical protein
MSIGLDDGARAAPPVREPAQVAADQASGAWHRTLSLSRSDARLNRYSIFVVLYATAFLLEMVEVGHRPGFAAAAVCLSGLLLWNSRRSFFFVFLTISTAYLLVFRFPDVANHVNLMIFCNLALIGGLVYSFARPDRFPDDDSFFEMIQPILRLLIIATFGVAGFHKLNHDFINPEVSCIYHFSWIFDGLLKTNFLGIPVSITVGLIALATAGLLWRHVSRPTIPQVDVGAILLPGLVVVVSGLIFLRLIDPGLLTSAKYVFVFVIAVIVLCWQLVEAPLLLTRRFQWFALCLCLLIHAQLAMIDLADFQALGIALLMTFMPVAVLEAWNRRRTLSLLGISMHRAHAYFLLNLIAGLVHGINHHVHEFINSMVVSGVLFNIGLLILLWPILIDLFSRDRTWRWDGVRVLNRQSPGFLYILPVALVLFGLTSHFGLRTAGNFSMFSNLRTEGERSNHLLFGSNPLKFGSYQEDVVKVHEIDDELARIGYQYTPLEGTHLPVVEFKKLIVLWREAGRVVPMRFEHDSKMYATENVVKDPDWQVDGFDWEMRLMDFRVIQPEGPNRCRW